MGLRPRRPGFAVAICDIKAPCSVAESRNMKSCGKRSALRLTASFRRAVVTLKRVLISVPSRRSISRSSDQASTADVPFAGRVATVQGDRNDQGVFIGRRRAGPCAATHCRLKASHSSNSPLRDFLVANMPPFASDLDHPPPWCDSALGHGTKLRPARTADSALGNGCRSSSMRTRLH